MNLFTVHAKNGLYIYKCLPLPQDQRQDSLKPNHSDEKVDLINNFKAECVWYQDRLARRCVCSLNNSISVVDDRSGLSLVYMKNNSQSDFYIDTLRGVGKFKNMYTPLGCKNINHLQWSNNGTYLVVYFNQTNFSESGSCLEDNLHIWDISKKNIIGTFNTKRLSADQWPVIKWISNTDNFAYCKNNQVTLYSIVSEGSSFKSVKPTLAIKVPMVFFVETFYKPMKEGSTSLSEGDKIYLASFSQPESNQTPANLRISTILYTNDTLVELSFTQHDLQFADSGELLWSPSGNYLLILAQSTVDRAGERYGSSTNCLLFSCEGKLIGTVNTSTTHDARWNPKADEFILMEGNMPCKITLYNVNLEPIFEFPNMYRNTIKWNLLGNMVALGGFGNLAGEICFWYRKSPNEMEQIVQFKEPCTVLAEWSLDSKYFMTASTFPRMKVDNFFKIFNCEGYLISSEKLEECYNVSWFCGNLDETEFKRPRVQKSLDRKPVYRPKMGSKPQKSITNKNFSKAPGSPVFSLPNSSSESSFTRSNSMFENPNQNYKSNKSVFSNEYGNKCDPSTDLFHSFKHVFSLSFLNNLEQQHMDHQRQPNRPDNQNFFRQEMHPQEFQRSHPTHPFVDPQHQLQQLQLHQQHQNQHPQQQLYSEDNRKSYSEIPRPPLDNSRQNPRDNSKNNSIFIKLKNQLQCEKAKSQQNSIMNEGQLLRLLLEARNRGKPD